LLFFAAMRSTLPGSLLLLVGCSTMAQLGLGAARSNPGPAPANDGVAAQVQGAQPAVVEKGADPNAYREYRQLEEKCSPGCYTPAPKDEEERVDKGCGSMMYYVRKIGDVHDAVQEWNGAYTPVPCADMPKAARKQSKEAEAFARTGLGSEVATKDAILELMYPDHPFGVVTNDIGTPIGKSVEVRVFRHDVEIQGTPCGDHTDGRLFCEAAGSKGAMAADGAAYQLKLASDLAAKGDKGNCRAAAWEGLMYVYEITTKHEQALKDKTWVQNGSYLLSDGRKVTDKELFDEIAADKTKALDLFHQCGGAGDPPENPSNGGSFALEGALSRQNLATQNAWSEKHKPHH
jgi:hypothetical protein